MNFLILALVFVSTCIIYVWKSFKYWESRGVPYIKPSIPFGNLGVPFFDKTGVNVHLRNIYQYFRKQGVEYGGFYSGMTPNLLAVGPDFIKKIMFTDFKHFSSQGTNVDEKIDPLSANVFHMEGKEWKDMRQKLSPSLSPGSIKMMFDQIVICGKEMNEEISEISSGSIDVHKVLQNYTANVAVKCLLGLEQENAHSKFIETAKNALAVTPLFVVRYFLMVTAPFLIKVFKLKMFPDKSTLPFYEVMKDITKQQISDSMSSKNVIRILLDNKHENNLSAEQITAQAFGFFIGGFDTTSYTLTFCLYELARHHDVQDKLRNEIESVCDGILTYEDVSKLKYLDQVIKETLRLYPLAPNLRRMCTEDYTLPNGTAIKKGAVVFFPVFGMQRDEKYFENPDGFQPERFSEENSANIHPFTYIPFGAGPRICLGKRFAMVQMKIALTLLLKNFVVTPHESLKYPMEFDTDSVFTLRPKNPVMLHFKKVQ